MHVIRKTTPMLGLATLAVLVPQFAHAQAPMDPITVTFTAPLPGQVVDSGSIVYFDADFSNPTVSTYQISAATVTSTDPTVSSQISSGEISGIFDGADSAGDPFSVAPSPPDTLVPGVFEIDLDPSLPGGETITGTIAFTGQVEDGNGNPTGPTDEIASQTFSIVTSTTPTPEPSSFAAFAVGSLISADSSCGREEARSPSEPLGPGIIMGAARTGRVPFHLPPHCAGGDGL